MLFYLQHPEMLKNWEHAMVLYIYHMLHFDKRKINAHWERIQVICSGRKVINLFKCEACHIRSTNKFAPTRPDTYSTNGVSLGQDYLNVQSIKFFVKPVWKQALLYMS